MRNIIKIFVIIVLLLVYNDILISEEKSEKELRKIKRSLNGDWIIRKEYKIKNKSRLSHSELNQIINSKISFISNHLIFRNDTLKLKDKNLEVVDFKQENVLDKEFKIDINEVNKFKIDTLELAYMFKFKSKQNNTKYNILLYNNSNNILLEYKNMLFEATKIYNFEN